MSIARAVRVGSILERHRFGQRRTRQISAALIVLAMLSLFASYYEGRVLGQDNRMYSPPYRWRQSLVIALSRLVPEGPSRSYSGYGSIENYFTANGLALFEHERGFDPAAPERWLEIQADGSRLNEMIARALKIPIDHALPPALLYANELGTVDYVDLAFRLFGPRVDSLYRLYYLLLALSCVLFVVQFRRSSGRLFLLCAYLAAHYFMTTVYIPNSFWQLATVHNSRFFSALGLLPALHLICIAFAPKEPLTGTTLATAAGQAALLGFLILCRMEVIWELAAVMFAALFALARLRKGSVWLRLEIGRRLKPFALLMLAAAAIAGALSYPRFVADGDYAKETGTHVFWHALLVSAVMADPELYEAYRVRPGDGYPLADDYIGIVAVEKNLTARGDASSSIAYRHEGRVKIRADNFNGEYDRLVRSVFFKLIVGHPVAFAHAAVRPFRQFFVDVLSERGVYSIGRYGVPFVAVLAGLALVWPRIRRIPWQIRARSVGVPFAGMLALSLPSIWVGLFLATGSITLIVMALLVAGAVLVMTALDLVRSVPAMLAARPTNQT